MGCECTPGAQHPTCGNSASWQYVDNNMGSVNTALLAYEQMESTFRPICEQQCICQIPLPSGSDHRDDAYTDPAKGKSSTSNTKEKGSLDQGLSLLKKERTPAEKNADRRRGVIATMCGLTCSGYASTECSGASDGGCECVVSPQFILRALNLNPFTTQGLCFIPTLIPYLLAQRKADARNQKYGLFGRDLQGDLTMETWDDYQCFCNSTHQSRDCCEDKMGQLPL
jgi:hypothetical protein